MTAWNCRLIEGARGPCVLPWQVIRAPSPDLAAIEYCSTDDVWDRAPWQDGDTATVEVEAFGGEHGIHRFEISAYNQIAFSAEAAEDVTV